MAGVLAWLSGGEHKLCGIDMPDRAIRAASKDIEYGQLCALHVLAVIIPMVAISPRRQQSQAIPAAFLRDDSEA